MTLCWYLILLDGFFINILYLFYLQHYMCMCKYIHTHIYIQHVQRIYMCMYIYLQHTYTFFFRLTNGLPPTGDNFTKDTSMWRLKEHATKEENQNSRTERMQKRQRRHCVLGSLFQNRLRVKEAVQQNGNQQGKRSKTAIVLIF